MELMEINRNKFTLNNMTKAFDDIMSNKTDIPQQVSLKLPSLKKVKPKLLILYGDRIELMSFALSSILISVTRRRRCLSVLKTLQPR